MSSSISSSKAGHFHWLALFLLATFVILEMFTRLVLFRVSKDFVRFNSYEARADALVKRPGLKVALVGNSATEEAVDPSLLEAMLYRTTAVLTSMDLFLADGSEVTTWRAMVNQYFWKRSTPPDLIVITFFGNSLDDTENIELGRLAQFFTDVTDWPDLFRTDLRGSTQRIEFLIGSAWATYAARDRIKQRILSLVVPDYRTFEPMLHDLNRRYEQASMKKTREEAVTHRALESLLAQAREQRVKVFLVAFPMRESQYKVNPAILKIASSSGADFIDMRVLIELQPAHYRDDMHLNAAGKPIYTKRFAEILTPMLKRLSDDRLSER